MGWFKKVKEKTGNATKYVFSGSTIGQVGGNAAAQFINRRTGFKDWKEKRKGIEEKKLATAKDARDNKESYIMQATVHLGNATNYHASYINGMALASTINFQSDWDELMADLDEERKNIDTEIASLEKILKTATDAGMNNIFGRGNYKKDIEPLVESAKVMKAEVDTYHTSTLPTSFVTSTQEGAKHVRDSFYSTWNEHVKLEESCLVAYNQAKEVIEQEAQDPGNAEGRKRPDLGSLKNCPLPGTSMMQTGITFPDDAKELIAEAKAQVTNPFAAIMGAGGAGGGVVLTIGAILLIMFGAIQAFR